MIGCRSEGLCWEGPHTQCQCDPPFPCQKMAFGKVTGGFGEREEGSRAVQQQQQHPKRFPILVAASLCQQSHPRREQLLQQHPGSHPDPSQSHPPPLTHHRLPAPASSHPPNPFSPPQLLSAPSLDAVDPFGAPSCFPAFAELSRGSSPTLLHYYKFFFLLFLSPTTPRAQVSEVLLSNKSLSLGLRGTWR